MDASRFWLPKSGVAGTLHGVLRRCIFWPVLMAGAVGAVADDWPHWRGPQRDGISREAGWKPELGKLAWRAKVGVGFSSMTVSQGRVYTMGCTGRRADNQETVVCLDAATGREIWHDTYPAQLLDNLHEGGPAATPTVDGALVFTLSKDGRLNCYEAATGRKQWTADLMKLTAMARPPEWGFAGSPLVVDDKVIVEATSTMAFDKKTGREIWRSQAFQPAYGSTVVFKHAGKTLLCTLKTEGLVILDAATGKTVVAQDWRTSFRTNSTTPLVVGQHIFVSTGYQRGCGLFAFDGRALKEVYTNKHLSNHMNNSIVLGAHVYGVDGNTHMAGPKQLVCLELATGKAVWRQDGFGCGSLMAVNDQLLVLSEAGKLSVGPASPKGFTPVATQQVLEGRCWTMPVLSNARIYCRNAAGDLICLDAAR
ncbi:MAG: alcohol dehydrogenase [Pedosphaera sp.]|nr:alcohol dehydrogenase [Pedosphaera sp.]MSU44230.1 alcohol dehydrogenase [Pedosphaera sp.]